MTEKNYGEKHRAKFNVDANNVTINLNIGQASSAPPPPEDKNKNFDSRSFVEKRSVEEESLLFQMRHERFILYLGLNAVFSCFVFFCIDNIFAQIVFTFIQGALIIVFASIWKIKVFLYFMVKGMQILENFSKKKTSLLNTNDSNDGDSP